MPLNRKRPLSKRLYDRCSNFIYFSRKGYGIRTAWELSGRVI